VTSGFAAFSKLALTPRALTSCVNQASSERQAERDPAFVWSRCLALPRDIDSDTTPN
jgi:hypothetical protein